MEADAIASELADDGQQNRVVGLVGGGVTKPHVKRAGVGQQPEPSGGLKQLDFFDLASHHDVADTGSFE